MTQNSQSHQYLDSTAFGTYTLEENQLVDINSGRICFIENDPLSSAVSSSDLSLKFNRSYFNIGEIARIGITEKRGKNEGGIHTTEGAIKAAVGAAALLLAEAPEDRGVDKGEEDTSRSMAEEPDSLSLRDDSGGKKALYKSKTEDASKVMEEMLAKLNVTDPKVSKFRKRAWSDAHKLAEKTKKYWSNASDSLDRKDYERLSDCIEVAEKYQESLNASLLKDEALSLGNTNEMEYYAVIEELSKETAGILEVSIEAFQKNKEALLSEKYEAASCWVEVECLSRKIAKEYTSSLQAYIAGDEQAYISWKNIAEKRMEAAMHLEEIARRYHLEGSDEEDEKFVYHKITFAEQAQKEAEVMFQEVERERRVKRFQESESNVEKTKMKQKTVPKKQWLCWPRKVYPWQKEYEADSSKVDALQEWLN